MIAGAATKIAVSSTMVSVRSVAVTTTRQTLRRGSELSWDGPWPGTPAFIFPEALRVVPLAEAEEYVHDGCPYCASLIRRARRWKSVEIVVNMKTRDVVAVIPCAMRMVGRARPRVKRLPDLWQHAPKRARPRVERHEHHWIGDADANCHYCMGCGEIHYHDRPCACPMPAMRVEWSPWL